MQIVSFIILSLIPVALMEITETADDDNDRIKRSGFGPIGGVLQVSTMSLSFFIVWLTFFHYRTYKKALSAHQQDYHQEVQAQSLVSQALHRAHLQVLVMKRTLTHTHMAMIHTAIIRYVLFIKKLSRFRAFFIMLP